MSVDFSVQTEGVSLLEKITLGYMAWYMMSCDENSAYPGDFRLNETQKVAFDKMLKSDSRYVSDWKEEEEGVYLQQKFCLPGNGAYSAMSLFWKDFEEL